MFNNIIVRLVGHYLLWTVVFLGIWFVFPETHEYVIAERQRVLTGIPGTADAGIPPAPLDFEAGIRSEFAPEMTVPVLMALVLTFVMTLPLTWVYRWTRRPTKHDQSFVHALLVIPIAIALVVFLVKGSLALAFSLAGIVAAVRFRTNLKQPMDGVYMFMAIGIGLAAGTQLSAVAFLASVIFSAVALGVWKTDYGAEPVTVSGWRIVRPGEKER